MLPQLLLIDDDKFVVPTQVRQTFPAESFGLDVATTGAAGLQRVQAAPPDLILLDVGLPDQSGLKVYEGIRAIDARIPVIFITMTKTADLAIEAMKQGAYDYLFKPIDQQRLGTVVREALEVVRRMRVPVVLSETQQSPEEEGLMVGGCKAMLEVYKRIGRVADQDVTVLITGESGTGKELVARAIYQHSVRANAPFLALNCAAIPENLLESELFGHEKGAFTGADRRRIGKFEQCNGGTILLDEIGDMPPPLQAKILRLLQEQTFERVGGNETVHTNIRLIASTHRDLKALCDEDKFRADLYYRLSVFTIHLPPLRERPEDLPVLVRYYLKRFSRELRREVNEVAPEALELLSGYSWPGNIRELQSVLKQALLKASGTVLLPSFLPDLPDSAASQESGGAALTQGFNLDALLQLRLQPNAENLYADVHQELDRYFLARVLEYAKGNRHLAARLLGIARQTLRLKLRETDIDTAPSVETEDGEQA
jgi:DNA-binding NtrC family response regulator